jgi:eukaryotic-like serine/threonine-protein kinase
VLGDFPANARAAVLIELLPIEIAWRQKSGETPSVDSYLFRFPELDQARLEALIGSDAATGPDEQRTQAISGSELLGELDSEVFSVGKSELSFDNLSVESAELLRDLDSLGIVDARLVLRSLSDAGKQLSETPPGEVISLLGEQQLLTRWQIDRLGEDEPEALVLGDYVLLDPLGKGGMGIVYRARHRRMDRLVALKTLTDRATESDDSVQRFQREVRAAARLSHPNIVAAYDAGEHHGVHYLVMELVDGIDLAKLVRQSGPLNANRAVDYVRQAATGFSYAHAQGIIHRDIKPQNLLVDRKQHVRILDMGLARLNPTNAAADPAALSAAQTELTQSGVIMGTVDFMSPEQATNTRNANEQSDIYSLGCTLYFLMTGRAMFDGETCMERLLAHHQDSRPSLITTVSKIPATLQEVFARMTARKPGDRYESMEDVAEALEAVQASLEAPVDGGAAPAKSNVVKSNAVRKEGLATAPEAFVSEETFITHTTPAEGSTGETLFATTTQRNDRGFPAGIPVVVGAIVLLIGLGLAVWGFWPRGDGGLSSEATRQGAGAGSDSRRGSGVPIGLTLLPDLPNLGQPACDWPEALPIQRRQREVAKRFGVTPFVENSIGMVLAVVPGTENGGAPFLIGTTEVTVREFGLFFDEMKYELRSSVRFGRIGGDRWVPGSEFDFRNLGDLPVSQQFPACSICWFDAMAFCDWLSEKENARYRLPKVAEWQAANAAGNSSRWFFGDDDARLSVFAWYGRNAGRVFHDVASKEPNALGIFDTLGNEYEWCLGNAAVTNERESRPQIGGGFADSADQITRRILDPELVAPVTSMHGAFRVIREF